MNSGHLSPDCALQKMNLSVALSPQRMFSRSDESLQQSPRCGALFPADMSFSCQMEPAAPPNDFIKVEDEITSNDVFSSSTHGQYPGWCSNSAYQNQIYAHPHQQHHLHLQTHQDHAYQHFTNTSDFLNNRDCNEFSYSDSDVYNLNLISSNYPDMEYQDTDANNNDAIFSQSTNIFNTDMFGKGIPQPAISDSDNYYYSSGSRTSSCSIMDDESLLQIEADITASSYTEYDWQQPHDLYFSGVYDSSEASIGQTHEYRLRPLNSVSTNSYTGTLDDDYETVQNYHHKHNLIINEGSYHLQHQYDVITPPVVSSPGSSDGDGVFERSHLPAFDKIQFSSCQEDHLLHIHSISGSPTARKKAVKESPPSSERERRKPGRKPGQVSNVLHLWEFMRDLLHDGNFKEIIEWISQVDGVFRVLNSTEVARLWGEKKKNKKKMTYEKLSRSLRYSRLEGYFADLPKDKNYPKKLCFKFGPKSKNWLIGVQREQVLPGISMSDVRPRLKDGN